MHHGYPGSLHVQRTSLLLGPVLGRMELQVRKRHLEVLHRRCFWILVLSDTVSYGCSKLARSTFHRRMLIQGWKKRRLGLTTARVGTAGQRPTRSSIALAEVGEHTSRGVLKGRRSRTPILLAPNGCSRHARFRVSRDAVRRRVESVHHSGRLYGPVILEPFHGCRACRAAQAARPRRRLRVGIAGSAS